MTDVRDLYVFRDLLDAAKAAGALLDAMSDIFEEPHGGQAREVLADLLRAIAAAERIGQ